VTDAATEETPHELVLTDRFTATPEAVWAAWTEPERFLRWWCAPGWSAHDAVLDVRPRGRFSVRLRAPDGSADLPFGGFYREVVPHERLVFTLSDADSPDEPARTELTVLLRAVDGGTEQEFHQTGVVSEEHFAALKAGTQQFFAQLGDLLRES
jgi:uncharacterized protein YndB with AHSA1/START domain